MIRRVDDCRDGAHSVAPEPLAPSPDGDRRADEMVRAARRVLEIVPGERRLLPEFGCRVHSLGALRSPRDLALAGGLVEEALERWLPDLGVDRAEVASAGDGWIRVALRIRGRWRELVIKHRVESSGPPWSRSPAETSNHAREEPAA